MGQSLETRKKLIGAASAIIKERGVGGFTLDAVAKHAGVSKGGLLHHYPSKDALISGIIEEEMQRFKEQLQIRYEQTEKKPGDLLRAYIQMSEQPYDDLIGFFGIMAAIGINPRLLDLVKREQMELNDRLLQDAEGVQEAHLILMTLDGLLYNDLFNLITLDGSKRHAIILQLLNMIRGQGDN